MPRSFFVSGPLGFGANLGHSAAMDLLSMTKEEIARECERLGEPSFRANQICQWLYQKRVESFSDMTDLPAGFRAKLNETAPLHRLELVRKTGAKDQTQKFLFKLADGSMIETVLIPASPALYGEKSDRRTICISSQVGCAYGCKFCASGLDGWKRNLLTGEILSQFIAVERFSGDKINNIVFMGMGEPFANYDNLIRAVGTLNAPWGIGLGARHMTVSTSGLVPRIKDFADQPLQARLAISLHGATDEVRGQIMPVNRKYPLKELLDACEYFTQKKKQFITFEYILIQGVNDTPEQARELGRHARKLQAKVNLIPYNTVEGLSWVRPEQDVQEDFLAMVRRAGATATLRREKGHDIAAACGQLRLQVSREKSFASAKGLN